MPQSFVHLRLHSEYSITDGVTRIDEAVSGRRKVAASYVRWLRRRNPEASPAEIISMLEHHYIAAISVAGAAITVGTVALELGISLIPGGSAAKTGTKAAAKKASAAAVKQATKQTAKIAGKQVAASAAKTGAQKIVALLPAGDEQLQFEITALFAMAVAGIHGLELDQQQAHALVYGLSNERVSQAQIATMASDLASSDAASPVAVGLTIAGGRKDWSHWANTLADALPGQAAQDLVRGVQTGALEDVRVGLDGKKQATVEYGVGALVGGVTRFVFGREVVDAARSAFAPAPPEFPPSLQIPSTPEKIPGESNRALEALQDAAKTVGVGLSNRAAAVGSGAAAAAGAVSRPFRRVDLDGDGVPDEARALTAAKGLGTAATQVTRKFRRVDLDGDGVPDEAQALTAVREAGRSVARTVRSKRRAKANESDTQLGTDVKADLDDVGETSPDDAVSQAAAPDL